MTKVDVIITNGRETSPAKNSYCFDTTTAVPQSPHRNIFNVFPVTYFGMFIFSGVSLE